MEKSSKFQRMLAPLTGKSILVVKSDEVWAAKRKHLGAAFYKEKLNPMMCTIIDVTFRTVE